MDDVKLLELSRKLNPQDELYTLEETYSIIRNNLHEEICALDETLRHLDKCEVLYNLRSSFPYYVALKEKYPRSRLIYVRSDIRSVLDNEVSSLYLEEIKYANKYRHAIIDVSLSLMSRAQIRIIDVLKHKIKSVTIIKGNNIKIYSDEESLRALYEKLFYFPLFGASLYNITHKKEIDVYVVKKTENNPLHLQNIIDKSAQSIIMINPVSREENYNIIVDRNFTL